MGFAFAFMSACLYAGSNIVMRIGMKQSKNDNGLFVTMVINVIVLGLSLCVYRSVSHQPHSFNLNGFFMFVMAGFLTTLLGRSMFFAGIRRIGASKASAIKNSAPIFTLFFALFILNEQVGGWPWIGICLIFFGLYIQGKRLYGEEKNNDNAFGHLFALGAAVGFGIGQGVRKKAMASLNDPFLGAFIGSVVALVSFSIIGTWKRSLLSSIKENIAVNNKYYIIGGMMTSFAVLSFFVSLWFIQVAYAGAVAATEPILTVLLSTLFLKKDDAISFEVIISAIVIFLGAGIIALTG